MDLNKEVINTDNILKKKWENSAELSYFSLIDQLCNQQGCLTYIDNNKQEGLWTFDYGHLSPNASQYVAKNMLAQVVLSTFKDKQIL